MSDGTDNSFLGFLGAHISDVAIIIFGVAFALWSKVVASSGTRIGNELKELRTQLDRHDSNQTAKDLVNEHRFTSLESVVSMGGRRATDTLTTEELVQILRESIGSENQRRAYDTTEAVNHLREGLREHPDLARVR